MSLGVDVWSFVLVDYVFHDVPPIDVDGNHLYGNNSKAKNTIPFSLFQAREVWFKIN